MTTTPAPWQPVNQFVLIELDPDAAEPTKSEGGIYMAGNSGGNFLHATVIATSEGVFVDALGKTRRPFVRRGQRVAVVCTPGVLPGLACSVDNQRIRMVEEGEVCGVLEDAA